MEHNKLKKHGIKTNGSVEITSHTPINVLGKYMDYSDGSLSSFNVNELYFQSISNTYKQDYVKVYFSKGSYMFSLKKLQYSEEDKGTLKGLLFGVFKELINLKLLKNFNGIKFSYISTIKPNEGFYTNFLINFIKSIDVLYDLKMPDSLICQIIQKIYKEYFNKIVPLIYLMSFFVDGVCYINLVGNKLTIGNALVNLDRFSIFDLRIKDPLSKEEDNGYLTSLYDVYTNAKKYLNVNNLSEVDLHYTFNYLFGPYSRLKDFEKLVITYYFEEEKRCKHFLESFNDNQISTKLFDAINQSNVESGAYLNLNARNNHLEAGVYKAIYKNTLCVTEANIEANNNFIFITKPEEKNDVLNVLLNNKNNELHELTISPKGVEISIN